MYKTMCDKLVYGKMCVHGHVNENGLCIRYARGGTCVRCSLSSMEDAMDEEIELYYNSKKSRVAKELTEEQRKRRSESSMRWTAKNKEKHKEYQNKYYAKPEVKEHNKKVKHEWYKNLTPEEKRAVLDREKVRRKAMTEEQKEERRASALAAYHAKPKEERHKKYNEKRNSKITQMTQEEKDAHRLMMHEKKNAQARARYAAMTMEERRALAALNKERQKAKKEREDD